MDEQTLEPCPFCGSTQDAPINCVVHVTFDEESTHPYGVQCDGCCAFIGSTETEDEAITAWNHRAAHSVIAGKVAELEREAALVREALDEAMRRYPDARPALAWFGAASGLSAGEITQEVLDWASAALAPYPERRSE